MNNNLIRKQDVFEAMEHVFNNYCNNARNFEEEETKAIDKAFKWLRKYMNDITVNN